MVDPPVHVEDPFTDPEYEDPEAEEEIDPLDEELIKRIFALQEPSSELERLASVTIDKDVVKETCETGKTYAQDKLEGIDDEGPNQRYDTMLERTKAVLPAAERLGGNARATVIEGIFGIVVDPASANAAETRDLLFTHIYHAAREEPMPETLSSPQQRAVFKAVDAFHALRDGDFWRLLRNYYSGDPQPVAGLDEHLVLMGIAAGMRPLHSNEWFIWPSKDEIVWRVDQLIAASGATPNPIGRGLVDVAAMYDLASMMMGPDGNPLPLPIVAELVRLAAGELRHGVDLSPLVLALPLAERSALEKALVREPVPAVGDPTNANDRNALRTAARGLMADTMSDLSNQAGKPWEKAVAQVRIERFRRCARASRYSLDVFWRNQVEDVAYRVGRDVDTSAASAFRKAAQSSGVEELLRSWSALRRSAITDPKAAATLLGELSTSLSDLGAVLEKLGVVQQTLREQVSAIGMEIGYEAVEILRGGAYDRGGLLDAARATLDVMGMQGRQRTAARLARDGAKTGLGDVFNRSLKPWATKGWASQLETAANAWSTADRTNLDALAKATEPFHSTLNAVRGSLGAPSLSPTERYVAEWTIDAFANAAIERLQAALASGDPAAKANHFELLAQQLGDCLLTFPDPGDLATFWSHGEAQAKNPPAGLTGLPEALGRWQKEAGKASPDPGTLSDLTFTAVELLNDYRLRIEAGPSSPDDKTLLMSRLDAIIAAMTRRLAQVAA